MAPPSQLSIATSSLKRLVKEEASYHKELQQQGESIRRLEQSQGEDAPDEQGNREFQLRQERKALEETKAVFPSLKERIHNAIDKLDNLLESSKGTADPAEITAAKDAVSAARTAEREVS